MIRCASLAKRSVTVRALEPDAVVRRRHDRRHGANRAHRLQLLPNFGIRQTRASARPGRELVGYLGAEGCRLDSASLRRDPLWRHPPTRCTPDVQGARRSDGVGRRRNPPLAPARYHRPACPPSSPLIKSSKNRLSGVRSMASKRSCASERHTLPTGGALQYVSQ